MPRYGFGPRRRVLSAPVGPNAGETGFLEPPGKVRDAMKQAPQPSRDRQGSVATPALDSVLGSPVCLACGARIPNPRKGQKACSRRCRWRLWAAAHRGGKAESGYPEEARQRRDPEPRRLLEAALRKLEEGSP
jgi:hypothetical protein